MMSAPLPHSPLTASPGRAGALGMPATAVTATAPLAAGLVTARGERPVNASPDLAALEAAFERPGSGINDGGGAPPPGEPALHRLAAADGRALAARWFEPTDRPARAVAVVNAATGVPQRFYRHFAQWLSQRGYAVLTYDYRGIGESRQGPVRADAARMRDWALLDMPAALAEAARRRAPAGLPLLLVGHSFGGNAIGLAAGFSDADALLGVAAQSGDWRNWPGRHRWLAHAFFHALLPGAAHLLGKAPGWVLGGSGAGLPKGVALDWARWGRRRGYLFSDPALAAHTAGYQSFHGPVHLWHISDDWTYGPPSAVDALAAQFSSARVERPALDAAALQCGPIGHFGAFRARPGRRIWPQWLDRIESATPVLRAALQGR